MKRSPARCPCCKLDEAVAPPRDFLGGYCALCHAHCLLGIQVDGFERAALGILRWVNHNQTTALITEGFCPHRNREDTQRSSRLLKEYDELSAQFRQQFDKG